MQFHGNIYSKYSEGTNELIKQGAIPVTCMEDFSPLYEIRLFKINKNDTKR